MNDCILADVNIIFFYILLHVPANMLLGQNDDYFNSLEIHSKMFVATFEKSCIERRIQKYYTIFATNTTLCVVKAEVVGFCFS